MEWLRIQLQILRERGLKVILMGHVPPARTDSKESWDETCWQKFSLWQRQYRDIIVGNMFGHMNIDHFMLLDFEDLRKSTKKGKMPGEMKAKYHIHADKAALGDEDGEITVASASDYLLDLRNAWSKLPSPPKSLSVSDYVDVESEPSSLWNWLFSKKKGGSKGGKGGKSKKKYLDEIGGPYAERFSLALVTPSVVPNYFPTLRVFEYNITGLEDMIIPNDDSQPPSDMPSHGAQDPLLDLSDFDDASLRRDKAEARRKRKHKEKESRKKPKKYKFEIPEAPSKSAPPGPAYSPQTFTLLGYTQYFANLTHINNDFVAQDVDQTLLDQGEDFGADKWNEGKHGKHQGKKPKDKPHPKKFKFEVEYDTAHDKIFKLKDLTVRSYVDLARRIAADAKSTSLLHPEGEVSDVETSANEVDAEGKKHKKKKKKHGKRPHKKDGPWYTFVKRAFVSTMDADDIEDVFGRSAPVVTQHDGEQEVLEL